MSLAFHDPAPWRPRILIRPTRKGHDLKVQHDAHMLTWRKAVTCGPETFRTILAEVAEQHQVGTKQILGPRRLAAINQARQCAMFRLAAETNWSIGRIATLLCHKRTTVRHGIRRHAERAGLPVPSAAYLGTRRLR